MRQGAVVLGDVDAERTFAVAESAQSPAAGRAYNDAWRLLTLWAHDHYYTSLPEEPVAAANISLAAIMEYGR